MWYFDQSMVDFATAKQYYLTFGASSMAGLFLVGRCLQCLWRQCLWTHRCGIWNGAASPHGENTRRKIEQVRWKLFEHFVRLLISLSMFAALVEIEERQRATWCSPFGSWICHYLLPWWTVNPESWLLCVLNTLNIFIAIGRLLTESVGLPCLNVFVCNSFHLLFFTLNISV